MLDNIPVDKAILRGWLKAGYVEKRTLFATDEGTPGARTSSLGWGWTPPRRSPGRQISRPAPCNAAATSWATAR